MNNCGDRFHSEMAKFRFLNELIKVLSPKVGDGGYRAFQDKKCSSAAQRQWDLLAILLFVGVGLGLPETPCRHRTHQFLFLVDLAHVYHWYMFHFPLHQPKGRAAKSSFQRNAQLRNKTPCLSLRLGNRISVKPQNLKHISLKTILFTALRGQGSFNEFDMPSLGEVCVFIIKGVHIRNNERNWRRHPDADKRQ